MLAWLTLKKEVRRLTSVTSVTGDLYYFPVLAPVEHVQPSNHELCENDCPREGTYSHRQHLVSDSGGMGGGGEGEKGSGDGSLGGDQLLLGFVNCRGWW